MQRRELPFCLEEEMFLKGRFAIVAVAILIAIPFLSACGEPQASAQPTAVTQPTSGSTGNTPATVSISMTSIKFVPADLTVQAGTTVVWTNNEAPPHTVTEDNNAFDSGQMKKGATFSHTFDTPGTVSYFCTVHGKGMSGKITVTAASAGGGGATNPTPIIANNTPTQPQVAPTEVVAPATAAPVATSTIPAPQTTDTPAPSKALGSIRFRDDTATMDQAVISIDTLPARLQGKAQYAWLTNGGSNSIVNLGRVAPNSTGGFTLNYSTPDKGNVLALYDGFKLTNEVLETNPATPSADVVMSGALPPLSVIHIRHLIVSFEDTPKKVGLEIGLLNQVDLMRQHAEFMRDSQAKGNLASVKLHAEHLVNIIEGAKGTHYGDLNKDGKVTNPGDGYGLLQGGTQLGYLFGSKDHAELAATAPDATDDIKIHAGHVGVTTDNVTGWVTTIRDKSLEVLKAADTAASTTLVAEILKLANQARDGVDLKGDGQILPIPSSGGALTSYQHAQLIAIIKITGGTGSAVQATAVPQVPVTTAPVQPTAASIQPTSAPQNGTTISMQNFKFSGGPTTVKLGTTITWVNNDAAPHTATADNNSFDSGVLQKGQSFSYTPKDAGDIKYYCALHGGPDGQGMSSLITVQP